MFDNAKELLSKYAAAFSSAWAHRSKNPPSDRQQEEADFLPAMLEIQESPAHPMATATMWLILILFAIAIAWMIIGKIDIVSSSTGKILPDDRVKVIQSAQSGVVQAIHVRDGTQVQAGDILLELDSTGNEAEISNLQNELVAVRLEKEMVRLLSQEQNFNQPPNLFSVAQLDNIANDRKQVQQHNLDSLFFEQKSLLAKIKDEIQSLNADLQIEQQGIIDLQRQLEQQQLSTQQRIQSESIQIEKIKELLPFAKNEYDSFKKLYEQDVVSRLQMQRAQEKYLALSNDLKYKENQMTEIRTAGKTEQIQLEQRAEEYRNRATALRTRITAQQKSLQVQETKFRREMDDRYTTALQNLHKLEQQLIIANQQQNLNNIVTPVDGIVQQLKVNTPGAVVQAAESLMVLVPKDPNLVVEVFIENKDIGFIHIGQSAEIKVDAFPYTKYGLIPGEVIHLSADAIEDEQRGLIYQAKIKMLKNSFIVQGEERLLSPGMSVVAEIKTGQRKVYEFFLSPLIQHGKESLGER